MRQCRSSGSRTLRLIWPVSMSAGVSSVTACAGTWGAPAARRSGGGAIRRVKSGLWKERNETLDTKISEDYQLRMGEERRQQREVRTVEGEKRNS